VEVYLIMTPDDLGRYSNVVGCEKLNYRAQGRRTFQANGRNL